MSYSLRKTNKPTDLATLFKKLVRGGEKRRLEAHDLLCRSSQPLFTNAIVTLSGGQKRKMGVSSQYFTIPEKEACHVRISWLTPLVLQTEKVDLY